MTPTHEPTFEKVRKIFTQEQIAERLGKDIRTVRRWEKGEAKMSKLVAMALQGMLYGMPPEPAVKPVRLHRFTFIDLFAGIGGTRLGFEAAGGLCVFTSEWDRHACQTYRANHEDHHEITGDITQVTDKSAIPDHDVLVAGFPCQPFSLAGVSKKNSLGREHGFRDKTQGTLFFQIADIIEKKRPKAFLLENVKNLRSHDGGNTFRTIDATLRHDLGYRFTAARVVDAAALVPQHRERIFIVGFREDCGFDWDAFDIPPVASGPKLRSILHGPDEEPHEPYTTRRRGRTVVGERYTLSDHLWNYLQAYADKHRQLGHGFGCSVFGPNDVARTLSARYHKDGSEILIAQPGRNPRRLTPRECARLMGFPDTFRIPVSDTQAYRQFGNSVVVPVVERIARQIDACLRGEAPKAKPAGNQLVMAALGAA
jgi:DNA (cytosine-5)-methyltransferase 1